MKTFHLAFFDGEKYRETFPEQETVSFVQKIINNIVLKYSTLEKILEELKIDTSKVDFNDSNLFYYYNNLTHSNPNLQGFLESRFESLNRVNKSCVTPPYYTWEVTFSKLKLSLKKEYLFSLLEKSYSYYKNRIDFNSNNTEYGYLEINLNFSLFDNKFYNLVV